MNLRESMEKRAREKTCVYLADAICNASQRECRVATGPDCLAKTNINQPMFNHVIRNLGSYPAKTGDMTHSA